MTDEEYAIWWPLHRRHALGESLSDAERRTYEAGIKQLDADEQYPSGHEQLVALRQHIDELRSRALENKRTEEALMEEIKVLEARYQEATGRSIWAAA